ERGLGGEKVLGLREEGWRLVPLLVFSLWFVGLQVTMGRGLGVTHRILARSCPLMVSRNHCTFRITSEGHCLVVDNQSLNGVWVNGERIEPQQVHRLSEGDVIRLGVPLRDKERAEYEYRLTWRDREQEEAGSRGTARTKDSVRVKRKHSCDQVEPLDTDGAQCYTNKIQRLCQSNTSENCTSRDRQRLTAGTDPGPSRDGQRLTAGTDPGPSRDGHRLTAGTDPGPSRDAHRLTAGTDPGPSRDGQRLTAGTDPGPSRDGQRLTAGTDPGPSMMRKTCIQSCPSGTLRAIPGVQADGLSVPGENDSHVEELAASVQGLQELQGKLHKSLPTEQQERKVGIRGP
ncbi:uncharacterized protein LOC122545913, partial [Chiloscyllium plagiosum]|uniref:uncharacterized protein LOC122545913 n=1 Tax=Chiloscyllium plagiosum TaxID=36176 RepID=UPI001CB833C7